MTSNFTESEEVYFRINTAINVVLFLVVVLPTFILCLLCALALLLAEGINKKIRILLINIFVPDVCTWLATSVLLLGYPVRATMQTEGDQSCSFYLSIIFVAALQRFSGVAIYSVAMYFFAKNGAQKLRLYYITLYIALSWVIAFAVGLIPYFSASGVSMVSGFCNRNETTPFYKGYITVQVITRMLLLIFITCFSRLACNYLKKSENVDTTDRLVKYLICLSIEAVLYALLSGTIPPSFSSIETAFGGEHVLLGFTIINFLRVFIHLPLLITPIAAMIILKQIVSTLKREYKRCINNNADEEPVDYGHV